MMVRATAAPARPATPATAEVDTTLTPKQLGFTMPGAWLLAVGPCVLWMDHMHSTTVASLSHAPCDLRRALVCCITSAACLYCLALVMAMYRPHPFVLIDLVLTLRGDGAVLQASLRSTLAAGWAGPTTSTCGVRM